MDAKGFVAIFAVSGSVAFLAMQAHKRLLSDFMTKLEFQIGDLGGAAKDDRRRAVELDGGAAAPPPPPPMKEGLEGMPQNWQVMYKGILQYRKLRGSVL